jgi:membrane protease YdiL (CAAX protease family)
MMPMKYKYRPVRFYLTVFAFTWSFWFAAAYLSKEGAKNSVSMPLMLLGLLVPSVTATFTVLLSKSRALKHDLRNKLIGLFRVKPRNIAISVLVYGVIIAVSILLSTFFGQSLGQFSLADEFSFAGGGAAALLTIVFAALLEELGWRGYAEDSIAAYHCWFKESLIFGVVWGLWHLPLFLIPDTYHYNILQQNPWFLVNFFISVIPMDFLFTWVYVKNNRSILACMVFHFAVNFLQEKIAMTQVTKCVETAVLFAAAAIVVLANRDMFFETRHVGVLLGEEGSAIK